MKEEENLEWNRHHKRNTDGSEKSIEKYQPRLIKSRFESHVENTNHSARVNLKAEF